VDYLYALFLIHFWIKTTHHHWTCKFHQNQSGIFFITRRENSLCFTGLFRTSGPPHLDLSVLLHSCCCNSIHIITSILVFSFQVDLLLVRSIVVASYMEFISHCQSFCMVGYEATPTYDS
jgi:hypothetical protein